MHVKNSFKLYPSAANIFYLNLNHDTTICIRDNYLSNLEKIINRNFKIDNKFLANFDEIYDAVLLSKIYEAEFSNRALIVNTPSNLPSYYTYEFSYWNSRRLFRIGLYDEAIKWALYSISTAEIIPDSYLETIGNFLFDCGRINESLPFYKRMEVIPEVIRERIVRLDWLSKLT